MPFSKMYALLILIGIIPVLIGALFGEAFFAFAIYNILLLILFAIDLIITPGPKSLEVTRVCDSKFSLGIENEILFKVRNNSDHLLNIQFRDEIPLYFKAIDRDVKIKALPHYENQGKYLVVPSKRGKFEFGDIYCKYNGILRLCSKSGRFKLKESYKVYPNIRDLRKFSLLAFKKSQLMQGVKKTQNFGLGTEFESLREYTDGDDYRKINWMATARTNKLIVNTYQPERNQQVFILLDSSRVMNSEINYIKKLDYAINASFLLADVATRKGDNTGLLVFDSEVRRFIKPGKGMAQFQLISENLYNVEENFVTADYNGALIYLGQHQKRRSLLCIFTELFNTDEAVRMINTLKSIARNHMPLIITINDTRLYKVINDEVNESNDVFLKCAAIKLVEQREKIKKLFSDSGIACIDVPPDRLSIEVVNKYLAMKSKLQV